MRKVPSRKGIWRGPPYGWLAGGLLLLGAVFWHEWHLKIEEKSQLNSRVKDLLKEQEQLQAQHEELLSEWKSGNDPAWIELILKEKLGMICEGERKVVFREKAP